MAKHAARERAAVSGRPKTDSPLVPPPRQMAGQSQAGDVTDDQLRLLVASTLDYAIYLLSPTGEVMTWNAGAARAKGYRAEEIVGRHFSVFYTADEIARGHPQEVLAAATASGHYSEEGWRVRKDGSRFWASVTLTALHDDSGRLRAFGKVTRDLTERVVASKALASISDEQAGTLQALAEGVMRFDLTPGEAPHLAWANPAAAAAFEPPVEDLVAPGSDEPQGFALFDRDGVPLLRSQLPFHVTAHTGQPVRAFVWGWQRPGEGMRWVTSNAQPLTDADGTLTGIVFSLADVTRQFSAQKSLLVAHARFTALVENSSDAICIISERAVVAYASPAYARIFGEPPASRIGQPITDRIHSEDRRRFSHNLSRLLSAPTSPITFDCRVVRQDETVAHVEITAVNRLDDPAVAGIVINSRDVTERVETATRLAHEAMHDSLTGLANRALLVDRLSQSLVRRRTSERKMALLFLDLDHFKLINDSLGHATGDQVLVISAQRLQATVRPQDTVARLGGDEFVVLAEDVSDGAAASVVAQRIRHALSAPIELDGRSLAVDCSIGISLADGSSPEALLQQADTALYRAKMSGRGHWELFDQTMRVGAQQRMDTEWLVRQSIGTAGVIVQYQPILAITSGRPVGSEALVRLAATDGTMIAPDDFIPVAEDTGLIVPLGLEVLRSACAQQAQWIAQGSAFTRVSVNLSPRQLRSPRLIHDVRDALEEYSLPAAAVCLELTESSLMVADRSTRTTVQELADIGLAIALDDFGTGMSSLAHLREFPITDLKIDRTFIAGLGHADSDTELVRALIGLGRSLGLNVVAEGVETADQAQLLSELRCPQAQGYFFHRPTDSTTLTAWSTTAAAG